MFGPLTRDSGRSPDQGAVHPDLPEAQRFVETYGRGIEIVYKKRDVFSPAEKVSANLTQSGPREASAPVFGGGPDAHELHGVTGDG